MPSHRDNALDALGIPSEQDSLRSFRSVCSTDAGARWLEQAVDPMHDRGVSSASMPDGVTGRSVVQVITRRFTLQKPASLPDDAKFDALVHFAADLNTNRCCNVELQYNPPSRTEAGVQCFIDLKSAASSTIYGGVMAQTGAVGTDLTQLSGYCAAPWFNGTDPTVQYSDFPTGGYRLVGGSLEVYNTTPELYASGSVTCYRQANRANTLRCAQVTGVTAGVTSAYPGIELYPAGPASVGTAQLYPDSVTMKAVDGCYMPIVVNTNDVIEYPTFGSFLLADRRDSSVNQKCLMQLPITGNVNNPSEQQFGNWMLPHRCQPMGAYFSGLSPQTSLDVVARFIVELFPSVSDSTLLPLTRPSASLDTEALEAYRLIMAEMPIAVPVAWNGLGTWLKSALKVAKSVGKTLMPVAKAVVTEMPGGDTAWALGNATVNAVKDMNAKRKQKKKDEALLAQVQGKGAKVSSRK